MGGDGDLELIEQQLLLRRGLRHTSEPDLATVGRRQDDVRALQGGEERQGPRRGEAVPRRCSRCFNVTQSAYPRKATKRWAFARRSS